jgi:hypothetical protein
MKKFSQSITAIHEAETAAKSELQKSYQDYFTAKLSKFGVKSPADLDDAKKSEFFSEISKDWESGKGATKAGQADVEKHGVKESEEVNEGKEVQLIYDATTNRKSELEEFKSQIHSTIDKSIKVDINSAHNSILIRTDAKFASKIEDLAKSFEIENVSESEVNEADMTKFYDGFIVLDFKNKKSYKFKYVKGTSNVSVENAAIDKLVKATGITQANFTVHGFVRKGEWDKDDTPVLESYVNEAVIKEEDVKSEADFKEYAMAVLKKAHPDDFDKDKANDTINGILKKCDGDYGAAIGMLTSSLGESSTNEGEECPMCKCDPCECYQEKETNENVDINEAADVTPYLDEVKKALPQLEELIKKKLGFKPALNAGIERGVIKITSNDIINELGRTLVKTIFTKVEIGFWGGNVTGDGKSIWFNPKLWYEHPSGGSNGTDFVWDSLWWDLNAKKWIEGRSIVK